MPGLDASACPVPRFADALAGGDHAHLETRMGPRADVTTEELAMRFAHNTNDFDGKREETCRCGPLARSATAA